MKPLKILVPIDFSSFSDYATDLAIFLAHEYDAQLTILHVIVMYETGIDEEDHVKHLEGIIKERELNSNQLLNHHKSKGKSSGTIIESKVLHDVSAANAILDYIEHYNYDLVIMGTHGRTGIKNLIFGSVAEKVVRMSNTPVITTHNATGDYRIQKIVVPVDFSDNCLHGIEKARSIAKHFNSELHYIHIIEQQLHPSFYVMGVESVLALDPNLKKLSQEKLVEFCYQADERAKYDVLEGTSHHGITDYAKDISADMIVMATHGYTGLEHILIGSTAERVVRIAPCPVLTVGRHEKRNR